MTGPGDSGKSSIARYIAAWFAFKLVDWVKLIEKFKVKLGTEESTLEEITQLMIENYFVDKLNPI